LETKEDSALFGISILFLAKAVIVYDRLSTYTT